MRILVFLLIQLILFFIEKDGKHSYTFQIINEEDKSIVEN